MTFEQLEQQRRAILDDAQLPLSTTHTEHDAIRARRQVLDQRIGNAREATATLATLGTAEVDEQWRDLLTKWRVTLCAELLALPRRIRDAAVLGTQENLTISVQCIDFGPGARMKNAGYDLTTLRLGHLMKDAGYEVVGADPEHHYAGQLPWFGSLPEVEARIAALATKRAMAQAALDDALLDDDVRAQRDAENKVRIDALNAAPQRKVRGDGSQYDKYADGRRVEVVG